MELRNGVLGFTQDEAVNILWAHADTPVPDHEVDKDAFIGAVADSYHQARQNGADVVHVPNTPDSRLFLAARILRTAVRQAAEDLPPPAH